MTVLRCQCGGGLESPRDLYVDGEPVEALMCDACWKRAVDGYRRLQADADELRAKGLHPKMLNRVMCARVERGEYME